MIPSRRYTLFLILLVLSQLAFSANKKQTLEAEKKSINLASVSSIVVDAKDGSILLQKNPNLIMPIASITKLMTAIVVLDAELSLKEKIRFSHADKQATDNYFSRIRIGSELSRGDTLRIALMSSENLAAAALGRSYPGGIKAFVQDMNNKAKKLGMKHTTFVDSTGLSERNRSTAVDVAKLVIAASKYSTIKKYTTTTVYTARFGHPHYRLAFSNTNILVRFGKGNIKLSKTGYLDKAGRCLVILKHLDNKDVVMVMLDSFGKRSPIGDVKRIRKWLQTGKRSKVAKAARVYAEKKLASYSVIN